MQRKKPIIYVVPLRVLFFFFFAEKRGAREGGPVVASRTAERDKEILGDSLFFFGKKRTLGKALDDFLGRSLGSINQPLSYARTFVWFRSPSISDDRKPSPHQSAAKEELNTPTRSQPPTPHPTKKNAATPPKEKKTHTNQPQAPKEKSSNYQTKNNAPKLTPTQKKK